MIYVGEINHEKTRKTLLRLLLIGVLTIFVLIMPREALAFEAVDPELDILMDHHDVNYASSGQDDGDVMDSEELNVSDITDDGNGQITEPYLETPEENIDSVEYLYAGSIDSTKPTSISVNKTINDAIDSDANSRYYKFVISKDGWVSITFEHENANYSSNEWRMELYNSASMQEKSLMESTNFAGNELLPVNVGLTGLPAGTYYIKLSQNWGDVTGIKYSFTVNYEASSNWEKEIDSASNRQQIFANTMTYASIQSGVDDIDYYEFDMSVDGYLSISYEHNQSGGNWDVWGLEVFSSSDYAEKNKILSIGMKGNEVGELKSDQVQVSQGTYYIRVFSKDDSRSKGVMYGFKVSTPPVQVTGILLDRTEINIEVGETAVIVPTVTPAKASDKTVLWSSSNPKIVTVDSNGLVTTLKKGTTTITAKTQSGGKKATCKVTVMGPTEVSMSKVTIKTDRKTYDWSANGVAPIFTVTYKGEELAYDEYEITYKNDSNYKAGTAVAIITGTGKDSNNDLFFIYGSKTSQV